MRYQIASPNGYMGPFIEAPDDKEATRIVETAPYRESVLDVMDWQDEEGNPLVLLVVADEPVLGLEPL